MARHVVLWLFACLALVALCSADLTSKFLCIYSSGPFEALFNFTSLRYIVSLQVSGPYPGLTKRGSLIGWGEGADARHRRSVDLEGSGACSSRFFFFFINLTEYGGQFLHYKI